MWEWRLVALNSSYYRRLNSKRKIEGKKNQKSDPWTKHTTIDNVNLCSLALSLGTTSNSDPKIPIRNNKFTRKEINQWNSKPLWEFESVKSMNEQSEHS